MLSGVYIKNFRCFKEVDLGLEKLTQLVGENGTGKTAILEAINLCLSPSFLTSRFDEQDFNNADEGDIVIQCYFNESFTVNLPDGYQSRPVPCNIVHLEVKRRSRSAPSKALNDPFTINHFVVPDDSVSSKGEGKWTILRNSGTDFDFDTRRLSFPLTTEGLPRPFYFSKDRTKQAETGYATTLNKIAIEYNWRFRKELENIGESYLDQWEAINTTILDAVGAKKIKDTYSPIKKKLEDLLGSNFDNLELSMLNLEQPFTKSFLAKREGLNQVNQKGFGSGISTITSFFLIETIANLAKEEILLLIDEPEMHLHPQLQVNFFKYISDIENQLIFSTHSEHLIDFKLWFGIRRIDHNYRIHPDIETLNSKMQFNDSSRPIKEHLEEFIEYYQYKTIHIKENNQLFFGRKCVLVEGALDKYMIERLSEFNINDLTIIPCYGKNKIFYYQMICKAFGIPYFTLFDTDDDGSTDTNKTLGENSFDGYCFSFKKSMENCFGISSNTKHKGSKTIDLIDNSDSKKLADEIAKCLELIHVFTTSY
ncbi:MAG: AAA family ATPase [Bacteroidota bacterium]